MKKLNIILITIKQLFAFLISKCNFIGETEVTKVKKILSENSKVPYGIFGVIESTRYFPPRELLNQFLYKGYDPCVQYGKMNNWKPTVLNENQYSSIVEWWKIEHSNIKVDFLDKTDWNEWTNAILEERGIKFPVTK